MNGEQRRLELLRVGIAHRPESRYGNNWRRRGQIEQGQIRHQAILSADERLYEAVRELLAKERQTCLDAARRYSKRAAAAIEALPTVPSWERPK